MSIVGIEFDRYKFDSPGACEQWLRSQTTHADLQFLLDRRTFRLKSGPCVFLSDERRKVWCWYALWDSKQFKMERPNSGVVILQKISSQGSWDSVDLPVPLPSTTERRQKLDLARQKREFKRRELMEKTKLKRKSKGKATVDKPTKKKQKTSNKKEKVATEPAGPLSPIIPPSILEAEETNKMEDATFSDGEPLLKLGSVLI